VLLVILAEILDPAIDVGEVPMAEGAAATF
jgi:hypothetical protein